MAIRKKARWVLASASTLSLAMFVGPALAQTADGSDLKLETVTVSATKGFGTDVTQIGGFRGGHIVDTPMTINVLPKDLLDAQQATSMTDILKNIAGANGSQVSTVVTSNQAIRGIPLDNRNGYRMDGSLPFINLIELPVEDKERVEVMKGAAGLYYGFASPAGVVNVTMKRPTLDPYLGAKIFGNAYGALGMAVDFGNTLHDGMFGYRINAVYANENPGITNTVGTRSLLAGAFDFKPFDNFTMQLDVEHIFKSQPEPGIFRFVTTPAKSVANPFPAIVLPDPNTIDPTVNFAPTWAQYRAEETNVLSHNTWSISDAWELTVDVGDSKFSRTRAFTTLQPTNFVTGDGFEQFQFSREEDENKNGRIQIAGTFDTFGLVHNALAGWQDNIRDSFSPNQTRTACAGGVYQAVTTVGATAATSTIACQTGITTVGGIQVNYKNPTFLSQMTRQTAPNLIGNVGRIEDAGFFVFDRISWGNYVDVLAGGRFGNYNDITIRPAKVKNFHATPATTSESVVVKPFGNGDLSIYASYVEALESTGGAPSTAANAGQTLAPLPSLQRELGVKSEYFSGLLLTADYFDIRRASTFVNGANVYVEDGKAKYSGFEVSASGEVTENLSVFVNGLLQMAKQISGAPSCGAAPFPVTPSCSTFSPSLVGNNVSNTAKAYGSAFAQYKLDDFVDGLAINGGIHYVGGRPLDATNQAVLPAYFTIDLGASYTTDRFEYPVTFRINAQNVTGKRYYASGDSDLFAVGQPQTVNFSLETHL